MLQPHQQYLRVNFSTSEPTLVLASLFDYSPPHGYEMICTMLFGVSEFFCKYFYVLYLIKKDHCDGWWMDGRGHGEGQAGAHLEANTNLRVD